MRNNKFIWLGITVALLIAIGGYFYPRVQSIFGAITGETNYNTVGVSGLKVGSSCNDSFGSTAANGCKATTHLIVNTCDILGGYTAQAASTTVPYDCAITGVTSSDNVIAQFKATTTPLNNSTSLNGSFEIVGARASTTAGYVTLSVRYNGTTSAQINTLKVGSSTQVSIFQ